MIGVVFAKLIFGHFKSPKIAQNSGVVRFIQKLFFKNMGFLSVIEVRLD